MNNKGVHQTGFFCFHFFFLGGEEVDGGEEEEGRAG